MQIIFDKKEMDKNIEFTKIIYSIKNLDGYLSYFDKFPSGEWTRFQDKDMTIEKFLDLMRECNFFNSKLFIGIK